MGRHEGKPLNKKKKIRSDHPWSLDSVVINKVVKIKA